MRVWDVGAAAEVLRLDGIGKGIAAVAWKPDGTELTSVSWDRTRERGVWGVVKSWDARTGKPLRSLEHGVKPISCAAYSPDGVRFAAGTRDDDVAVRDTSAWGSPVKLVPPKDEANKAVQAVAFSRDGRSLAAGGKDGTVRVWDVPAAKLAATLVGQAEGQAQWVIGVAWVEAGLLAAAGSDRTVRLWDVGATKQRAVLHGHDEPVTAVAARADGTLRLWDPASGANVLTVPAGTTVYATAFSPDGTRLAMVPLDGTVVLLDSVPAAQRLTLRPR